MSESTRPVRYRVNEPAVIHQAIDGELVIIHLDQGLYYSVDSTGARIWQALAAGQPTTAVTESLAHDYDADMSEVAQAVDALVERLRAEDLLVPISDGSGADQAASSNGAAAMTTAGDGQPRGAFQPPVLQRYEDLQDLLLLDPIHAVDESGWPDRRVDA